MVLYADGGAHDGVVATAGTRDQISWWQRRWRRGGGLLRQAERGSFNTREIVASRPPWRARPRKEIVSYRRVRGIGSLSFPKGIGPEKNRGRSYLRSVAGLEAGAFATPGSLADVLRRAWFTDGATWVNPTSTRFTAPIIDPDWDEFFFSLRRNLWSLLLLSRRLVTFTTLPEVADSRFLPSFSLAP